MTRLIDGRKTAEITMHTWEEGNGYTPDWSADFFETGLLIYDEETEAYWVNDVDYCIDQAREWEKEAEDKVVDVYENKLEDAMHTRTYRVYAKGEKTAWNGTINWEDGSKLTTTDAVDELGTAYTRTEITAKNPARVLRGQISDGLFENLTVTYYCEEYTV